MVKGQQCFAALKLRILQLWAAVGQLLAVILHQGPACEAFGHVAFVLRVNVIRLADVGDDALAGFGQFAHGERLRLAQFGPVAVSRLGLVGFEVGQLHPVEGEIALLPFFAPMLDHEGEQLAVFLRAAGVRFALIPNRALDAITNRRMQHACIQIARTMLTGQRILRRTRRIHRNRFAGLECFFPRQRPGIDLGFVIRHLLFKGLLREGRLGLLPLHDDRGKARVFFQHVALHPRLAGAAAPGVVDQAHRHAEDFMQHSAEMITHRRELACVRRTALLPLAFEIVLNLLCADLWHRDEANQRMLRLRDVQIRIPGAAEVETHVRLARADPHLAHKHVFQLTHAAALDRDPGRFRIRRHRVEFHGPFPLRVGLGGLRLVRKRHRHLRTWLIPPPDRIRLLLLQNHVVANDGREFQFRVSGQREAGEKEKCESGDHDRAAKTTTDAASLREKCHALLAYIDHNRFEALSLGESRLPQIAGDEELRRRSAGCGHMQNVESTRAEPQRVR